MVVKTSSSIVKEAPSWLPPPKKIRKRITLSMHYSTSFFPPHPPLFTSILGKGEFFTLQFFSNSSILYILYSSLL
jgi:hypothetical protein